MKKVYIVPSAKAIRLTHAENVLVSMSINNQGEGEIEGGMTNEQNSGNSLWDSWNE